MRAFFAGWTSALVALLLVFAPRLVWACAVCGAGLEEETSTAFILTTVLLSALPPAMVGSLAYWLIRRARAHERASEALTVPVPLSPINRASSSR